MQWFDAWTLREILDYLDENFLTVVDAADGPYLQRHPHYRATDAVVSRVLPHLSVQRDAVLSHFRGMGERVWEGPTAVPCPNLSPADGRRALFAALRFVALSVGGRVGTHDGFTRLTGWVDDRDSQFRPGVTMAAAIDRDGREFTRWVEVPGATPPRGWEPPPKPARWNPYTHDAPADVDPDPMALPD